MIFNSILLLLLPSLLFYATLSQDKLANPQVKITYASSPPKTPKEFPLESELSKIANILSSGSISMLATTISAVTNNNDVTCKDKANYVTKATELLKKRLTSNEQQLKILQAQPVFSAGPGKNTDELKNMLSNLQNSLLQKNYDSDLKALEFERKQIN